jgi:hypothetical protein
MHDYGLWYKMAGSVQIRFSYTKLFTCLTGSLYGTAIVGKPTLAKVARGGGGRHLGMDEYIIDITYGFEGVGLAREYFQQNDARLERSGKTWYMDFLRPIVTQPNAVKKAKKTTKRKIKSNDETAAAAKEPKDA